MLHDAAGVYVTPLRTLTRKHSAVDNMSEYFIKRAKQVEQFLNRAKTYKEQGLITAEQYTQRTEGAWRAFNIIVDRIKGA